MFMRSLHAALMVGAAATTTSCATSRYLIDAEVARLTAAHPQVFSANGNGRK